MAEENNDKAGLTEGQDPVEGQDKDQEPGGQDVPSNLGAQGADNNPQTIEAPEGLSNKDLWDPEKGQLKTELVIEELSRQTKRAEDLRKKLSNGVTVPQKAEEYEVVPTEQVKDFLDTKSEFFTGVQQIALKNGLSKDQFQGFVNDYLGMCVEKGVVGKPQTEEEQKAAQAAYVAEQKKILGTNADEQIQSAVAFIETEYRKGVFDENEKKALRDFADKSAVNIRVLNKLREYAGQPVVPVQGAQTDGLMSDAEIIEKWDTLSTNEQMKILKQREALGRPRKFME